MTRDEILKRFPNASASTIAANLQTCSKLPDPKPRQRQKELAGGDDGEAQGPGLRHCCFTLVRKQLLDVDAKYASTKDLLDCLTTAGIIRGDKEGQITLEVNQRKACKGEAEHTEIMIYESNKLD